MVVDGSGVVRYPSIHPKGHPHDAFEAIFWLCLGLSNNSKGMYKEGLTFKWDLTYYFLSIWNPLGTFEYSNFGTCQFFAVKIYM